jgi:tetratricopeptide (TPR) repeat protein/tRNA A-37 threonylcarbamoyl transferase component Bud32
MKCPDLAQLRLLLDGKLSPELFRPIEVHVEECPNCQATLHRLLSGAEVPPLALGQGNRYRPVRFHARGGLGEVFVAEEPELHREVALKRMQARYHDDPESCRRFLQEAEITGRLEHPGVVPVYGRGEDEGGQPCYAMRFIRGETLEDAIKRFHAADKPGRDPGERSLALRELLGRFMAVCNTVAYAHSRGILHRDLKPGNVMLEKYGQTLVVDWGLAKPIERDETARACGEETLTPASASGDSGTQTGAAMGTPAFMSPEQASGQWSQVGPASDIYSLGTILYTLLTGQAPFADPKAKQKLEKVKRGDFPRPRQAKKACPRALEGVCMKAMALRPENRYATALDLAADVEHWLADEPVAAYGELWPVRAARWARKHKPLVSSAAAALLVGLVALSAGTLWYQQAEAARRVAATENTIRQNIDQARQAREQLHAVLKKGGGVQELLNQPLRWQAQIRVARADWQTAHDLVTTAEQTLDRDLPDALQKLDQDLARDEVDYHLALRLETIRLNKATWVEGKFNYTQAEREYSRAFLEAGLVIEPGREKETAALIKQSAIKEQLLAALDDWAWLANRNQHVDLSSKLLEVGRHADPDPWRDQVRNPALWKTSLPIVKLAEDAHTDQKNLAQLSPQVLGLVCYLLPQGKQENWLRQAQLLHPADFWINFDLAVVLHQKKEALEAAGFYRVALALRPNTLAVYNNLGIALHDLKDLAGAIDAFKKILDINPKLAPAWNNLGNALSAQQDLPAAIHAYKKALAIDPKFAQAWNNLAIALHEQKDLPATIDSYKQALAIDPNYAKAWYNLGLALSDQKDLPAVIEAYKKALDIDPKDGKAWNNLGLALYAQKDLPAAIDAYKHALAIDPKDAKPWYNLGNALSDCKDLAAAIYAYKKAVAIDPKYALAWTGLGNALADQRDLPAAIDAYKEALVVDPKGATSWNNLGLALYAQKNLPAAIDAYKKALVLEPKFAQAWISLGNALADQRKLPAAIDAYKKALAIDPKHAKAWYNLGLTLHTQKDLPGAIDAYKRAIQLDPSYANVHGALAVALWDHGDFADAVAATQRALQLLPNGHAMRPFIERQLKQFQQLQASEERLPKALKGETLSASEYLALADLCMRYKKRYRDAVELYAKAFAAEPKSVAQTRNRYNAACAAALAAAGKGVGADNLPDKEKSRLRLQALDWLKADLAARSKLLEQNPFELQQDLQHWQKDADLAGVRDHEELTMFPAAEQDAWRQLWAEIEALREQARSSYTETLHKGTLTAKQREQTHPIQMSAGKTYMIDMESPQFDTYLRLEDSQGKVLAENDDISPDNLNSRILFTPKEDGTYRIIATSFQQRGSGAYTLTIRAFAAKK